MGRNAKADILCVQFALFRRRIMSKQQTQVPTKKLTIQVEVKIEIPAVVWDEHKISLNGYQKGGDFLLFFLDTRQGRNGLGQIGSVTPSDLRTEVYQAIQRELNNRHQELWEQQQAETIS